MADDIKDEGAPMTPGMLCTEAAHESLARLYAEEAWLSNDPYLRASIALLMRLEILHSYDDVLEGTEGRMSSHSPGPTDQAHSLALPDEDIAGLLASVEDYLWFRLWLCRPPLEQEATLGQWTSNSDFVNLTEIQENMRVCGSKHFDPEGKQPLVYAFVLVCCGLHEEAVSYLTSHANEHLMHAAVHIAIVLYQLRWIDDDMAFHAILARYISNFSRLFPTEAALYLMTLRDRDRLRQSLKELILETGEYELLTKGDGDGELLGALGKLPPRGKELPSGLTAADIENIRVDTAHVGALEAAQRGEFAIAADLYKLSGELAESADMTMRNLAEVVDKQSSSRRAPAIAEAQKVLQSSCASNIVATSIAALLKTSEFFEEYWKGRYQSAWDALRHTGVVPIAAADIANCRWDLAGSQAKFDHCLQENTLQVLQLALNIAEVALEQNEVQHLDSPPRRGDNRPHEIRGNPPLPYRSEMKALCMFAGCIQISDAVTSEKLIRIEMLLSR
ncbi:unnamed protein product [Chondrus crispus]|uniref:Nuclear pore protein n=1 Tax=Chondrus crispus TaxID=2769 RepID=R7Q9V9_CHOCR|nr:unnamed protein product [Chondrus crispus]CDF34186.1 unnamed protein product [Chondrus crispus]|eukprot:XP_005714005.1 unnamed protein product [Chondrus crispus]